MRKVLNPTREWLWFGTRKHMMKIPMPRYDASIGGVGWSTEVQLLDGRKFVRRSTTSHREYEFSWNLANRAALQPVFDFAAGIYGPGPYYFIDPFSASTNVLPEWWAAPGMALEDAPVLIGDERPQRLFNSDFSQDYPAYGAAYTVSPSLKRQVLWIPIPEGMTLWIGAHGPINTSAYLAARAFAPSGASSVPVSIFNTPVNSPVRCTRRFRSQDNIAGVELTLTGDGTLQLFGVIAQILPTVPDVEGTSYGYGEGPYQQAPYGGGGSTPIHPYPGGFIGGQGHSGVEFQNHPTRQGYSSTLDLIGAAATLIEVGGQ